MPIRAPDFEAEVRFLTTDEGGRQGPAMQRYRPDIHYDDDEADGLWMVWPRFIDDSGQELPKDTVIPQVSRATFKSSTRYQLLEVGPQAVDFAAHLEGDPVLLDTE